jgi:hypothetical protein
MVRFKGGKLRDARLLPLDLGFGQSPPSAARRATPTARSAGGSSATSATSRLKGTLEPFAGWGLQHPGPSDRARRCQDPRYGRLKPVQRAAPTCLCAARCRSDPRPIKAND